jgi:hypothetical protein
MNTTQTPTTTTTTGPSPKSKWRRRLRYALICLAAFAATIALFYAEEDWRGRRAWENCKRELEAKGAHLDWAYYIPPPVPDDQNTFGVPEMQKWFEGRGSNELSTKLGALANLSFLEYGTNHMRVVAANLTIGLPGAIPPSGSTVLAGSDTNKAKAEVVRLIKQALGQAGKDPNDPEQSEFFYMANKPEEVRAAQLFLQCEKAPTEKELSQYLPFALKLEAAGENSFRLTIPTPVSAAHYVAWFEKMEPDLAVVRQAVQRPYARLAGDYSFPPECPIPNFVAVRAVAQRLAALAECEMVLGQPEKALDALTFMHQLCRLLEARPTGRPMTLVAAMINVAVTGLYVETIKDGMRMGVWREPQLAALQEQLKEINLRPYVLDAFAMEQAGGCNTAQMTPLSKLVTLYDIQKPANNPKMTFFTWVRDSLIPRFSFYSLVPRGWVYQNIAVSAKLHQIINDSMAAGGPLVEPHKLDAFVPTLDRELSHWSPFKILAAVSIPNFQRATTTFARNQTKANQGQVVCALERYRLAHGEYPAALENLMPQFIDKIPPDLIGGQPPHYHRAKDGKFLLYSIGWSEKDHGGQSGANGQEGDWVWGED